MNDDYDMPHGKLRSEIVADAKARVAAIAVVAVVPILFTPVFMILGQEHLILAITLLGFSYGIIAGFGPKLRTKIGKGNFLARFGDELRVWGSVPAVLFLAFGIYGAYLSFR